MLRRITVLPSFLLCARELGTISRGVNIIEEMIHGVELSAVESDLVMQVRPAHQA
jgi:hypothetical protein